MIVYAVFSGSYSDRGLDAIFSTRELAMKYINQQKNTDAWQDIDDVPIEYELDTCQPAPEHVCFVYVPSINKALSYCYDNDTLRKRWLPRWSGMPEGESSDGEIYFNVKYNDDFSIMENALNDKLAALIARKEGI